MTWYAKDCWVVSSRMLVQKTVGTASVVFAPTIAWDLAIVQVLWLRLGPLIDTGGRMGFHHGSSGVIDLPAEILGTTCLGFGPLSTHRWVKSGTLLTTHLA